MLQVRDFIVQAGKSSCSCEKLSLHCVPWKNARKLVLLGQKLTKSAISGFSPPGEKRRDRAGFWDEKRPKLWILDVKNSAGYFWIFILPHDADLLCTVCLYAAPIPTYVLAVSIYACHPPPPIPPVIAYSLLQKWRWCTLYFWRGLFILRQVNSIC
jgi:hypothetical protein